MKKNNDAVSELRESLDKINKLTLESFIMPEENDSENVPVRQEEPQIEQGRNDGYDGDVRDAIIQIRKISIGIISKLADNPVSESYTFMKRVLDMSDKAIESMNNHVEEK